MKNTKSRDFVPVHRLSRNEKKQGWHATLLEEQKGDIHAKRQGWFVNFSEERNNKINARRLKWKANLSEEQMDHMMCNRDKDAKKHKTMTDMEQA